MAVGPIPWTAIDRYAERQALDDILWEDFSYLVRQMDEEFLKHNAEKIEPALQTPKGVPRGKAGRFRP